MWKKTGSLAALLCLAAAPAWAGEDRVQVTSEVDQDVVALDQTVTLTVTITVHGEGEIQRVEIPSIPRLRELGRTQSQQSSFSLGPGGMDIARSTIWRVSYQPTGTGTLVLPAAAAIVQGVLYKSTPVRLQVVAAGGAPRARRAPAQNPFSAFGFPNPFPDDDGDPFQQFFGGGQPIGNQDVFLSATLDRRQVYLGQQVTYTVRLFTRVEVNEFDELKLPGFDGFWGEDIATPVHPLPSVQNVGGVPYQAYLVKKKALFPSRAGSLTIGPAEVDVGAGGLFFRGRKLHRSTGALVVEALPLPPGAPAGFSTANVGSWRLSASLSPASVPAGEPATLTLLAQGTGNLHAIELPRLPEIPGLRAYDPTSKDKPAITGDRFGGTREVEVVLIGERTGEFSLPPLAWSVFDPVARAYRTMTTPPMKLAVTAGASGPGLPARGAQNVLEASFSPLRSHPALWQSRLPPLSGRALWMTVALPPSAVALLWAAEELRRRRERAAPETRMRKAYRVARRRVRAARAMLAGANRDAVPAELTAALVGYLEDRAGGKLSGLSHDELLDRLRSLGAPGEAAQAAVDALAACEAHRYAPGAHGPDGGKDLLSRVEWGIDALERSDWKRGVA